MATRTAFSRLLEMLDTLRFTRGVEINRGEFESVMARLLKADLVHSSETFSK
jgi:hypothetical protein